MVYGNIISIDYKHMTNKQKKGGICFIYYDNHQSALNAITNLNNVQIYDKKIKVELKKI